MWKILIIIGLIFLLLFAANNPNHKITDGIRTTGTIVGDYTNQAIDYGKSALDKNSQSQDLNTSSTS